MISFDVANHRFNFRAAAVVLRENAVLLHRLEGDAFWSIPGGRVEAGELASQAVVRELREELAESVVCGDLLWLVENFFNYRGQIHHELGMYFRVDLSATSRLMTTTGPYFGEDEGQRLVFDWFDRSSLQSQDVRPSFLADAMNDVTLSFRHVVHREAFPG